MGTNIRYGDVTIANVQTRQWSQTVQRDASNTDVLYHRHTIEVEGIVHAQPDGNPYNARTYIVGAHSAAVTFHDVYNEIRRKLLAGRQPLYVETGGVNTFSCVPAAGHEASADRDVDNGPKPKGLDIVHITSSSNPIFRVRWSVEVCKVECPGGSVADAPIGTAISPVLSNRWRVSEELDRDFYMTRTISGKLKLSQAVGDMSVRDDFKEIVVPGLEDGFRREAIDFAVNETGTECDYRVTDRQVFSAAPYPATSWTGTHSETATDHGANVVSEFSIRLDAPPHADRKSLIFRAFQCAEARLGYLERVNDNDLFVESFTLVEHLETNSVECHVRVRQTQSAGEYFSNFRLDVMGKPLILSTLDGESEPYDPRRSPSPAIYGYVPHEGERRPTVLMLLQCFLQSPCLNKHAIASKADFDQLSSSDSSNPLTPEITEHTSSTSLLPTPRNDLSEHAQAIVYTVCRMENVYSNTQMRLGLPIANLPAAAGGVPSSATSFVFLGPPQAWREIRFEAEAVGNWPHIPQPAATYDDGYLTGVLMAYKLIPQPPTLSADRRKAVFRVRGWYRYQLNREPTLTEKLSVGSLAVTTYTKADVAFDPQIAFDLGVGP